MARSRQDETAIPSLAEEDLFPGRSTEELLYDIFHSFSIPLIPHDLAFRIHPGKQHASPTAAVGTYLASFDQRLHPRAIEVVRGPFDGLDCVAERVADEGVLLSIEGFGEADILQIASAVCVTSASAWRHFRSAPRIAFLELKATLFLKSSLLEMVG
jgi:hypothetical protein